MKLMSNRRLGVVAVFSVAICARVAYWLFEGPFSANDTSWYTDICEVWIADPAAIASGGIGILYSGFTVPLCSFLSIPGTTLNHWVMFQILVSSLGCVLVYRIGVVLIDYRAGVVSGLALGLLWDTFQWDMYVLSDSLFIFAVVLVLSALAWHQRERTWRSKATVFVTMGYLIVVRPFGLALVVGWVLYDLYPRIESRRFNLLSTRWIPMIGVAGAVVIAPFAFQQYGIFELWERGSIIINDSTYVYPFVDETSSGTVAFALKNGHHLIAMGLLKILFFFTPLLPRHSPVHIIINLITYLPVILVGSVGLVTSWRDDFHIFRMLATPVIVMAAVTAVTFVSWDLRYRAPLGPVFALGFGYAVSTTLEPGSPFRRVLSGENSVSD